MSGGKFNYDQYKIKEIADDIQELLDKQGELNTDIPSWYIEQHPEDSYYEVYDDLVQEAMEKGVEMLRVAYIYAQRIDW